MFRFFKVADLEEPQDIRFKFSKIAKDAVNYGNFSLFCFLSLSFCGGEEGVGRGPIENDGHLPNELNKMLEIKVPP